MNLIKDKWTKNDIDDFHKYENELKSDSYNCEWESKIVNTKYPCYGSSSSKAKAAVKLIKKGNYISFLDNLDIISHFDLLCACYLINEIKDFDTFKKYLERYIKYFDSWAHTDTIKPKISKEELYKMSLDYIKSEMVFKRRMAIIFYFTLIKYDYFKEAYDIIDSLTSEEEYYVNIGAAWLLCELMIKDRDRCIKYYENNKTNKFIINKSISKSRESFRVSRTDKDLLLKYKIML